MKRRCKNFNHKKPGRYHPKLARNRVWCKKCGKSQNCGFAQAFYSGWPKCCGETMTIDSPEEKNKQAGMFNEGEMKKGGP